MAAWACNKDLMQGVNAPEFRDNWFWWVVLVAHKFYWLEASPKGSSLERFPMSSKKKKKRSNAVYALMLCEWNKSNFTGT